MSNDYVKFLSRHTRWVAGSCALLAYRFLQFPLHHWQLEVVSWLSSYEKYQSILVLRLSKCALWQWMDNWRAQAKAQNFDFRCKPEFKFNLKWGTWVWFVPSSLSSRRIGFSGWFGSWLISGQCQWYIVNAACQCQCTTGVTVTAVTLLHVSAIFVEMYRNFEQWILRD